MSSESWKRYCTYYNYYPEVGIGLDVSRMEFPDSIFESMDAKVKTAFREMEELEAGAIANPDEQRMVGHYWLRSPGMAPQQAVGEEIVSTLKDIKKFASDIHDGRIRTPRQEVFRNVLFVGIGGSALGPQFMKAALDAQTPAMNLYFVDNTDSDGIYHTLNQIGDNLSRTLVVIVSKSGGTVETRNGQIELAQAFESQGLSFAGHTVAVTCDGSKLYSLAKEQGWIKTFPMWDWVGGRTSIMSAVGLVPAALLGFDIDAFLDGARAMDAITRQKDARKNPAMLMALMWYQAGGGAGKKDMVVLPYKDRLLLCSRYLQQLIMESLGKEKDRKGNIVNQGIAVYGNKGSTDQHAYVQQLREGLNNFFANFIEVLKDTVPATNYTGSRIFVENDVTSCDYLQGFMLGTREALTEKGRQSLTITLDKLDARNLGSLIALYERTVGFYGFLIDVNAYDQPGVEAGKKAAGKVIKLQQSLMAELRRSTSTQALSVEELTTRIGEAENGELAFKVLEHLAQNGRIIREGERDPQSVRYRA